MTDWAAAEEWKPRFWARVVQIDFHCGRVGGHLAAARAVLKAPMHVGDDVAALARIQHARVALMHAYDDLETALEYHAAVATLAHFYVYHLGDEHLAERNAATKLESARANVLEARNAVVQCRGDVRWTDLLLDHWALPFAVGYINAYRSFAVRYLEVATAKAAKAAQIAVLVAAARQDVAGGHN